MAFPVRVLAPNPGPFTLDGTNTWVVGRSPSVVIDPGPDDAAHLGEVVRTAGRVAAVVLTHRHPDHAPGAGSFARTTGAPVWAFDPGPGERRLVDGAEVRAGGVVLRAVHTPGHTPDHVAMFEEASGTLFTGDAVLGRGTSVLDPPEGDLVDYIASLRRMLDLEPRVLCPGHGPVVWDALSKLREYIQHRADRERQIVEALASGPATPEELVPGIYADHPAAIHPVAARSVLAHLLALERTGEVVRDGDRFAPAPGHGHDGSGASSTT